MSRSSHNNEVCPKCGISYKNFRCSLDSWASVYYTLFKETKDSSKWRYKGRSGILGYWFQIKQEEWSYHLENCVGAENYIENSYFVEEY